MEQHPFATKRNTGNIDVDALNKSFIFGPTDTPVPLPRNIYVGTGGSQ